MTDSQDLLTSLSDTERTRLQNLAIGAKHVSRARNQLLDFADEHQWDEETLNGVLAQLRRTDS